MSLRWLAALVIACAVAVGALCAAAAGKPPAAPAARTETTGFLTVTSMSDPQGTVRVRLPADMAAGDTITGTVVVEPAGGSDAQRAANESILNGYVVEAGANKAQVAQRVITFVVPSTATLAALVLRRANGAVAGRADVPVRARPNPVTHPALPGDFKLPQVAVAGQPFAIAGPFSGDAAHTALAIGGRSAEIVAESPRTLVAVPPANAVGPSSMQLNESGIAAAAACNVLSLGLSASSTRLAKGAHATVHVTVGGLSGIRLPVYVRLVNATPAVVSLGGGQTQVLTIQPNEVRSDGTYLTDRDVTGLSAGTFSLNATLDAQLPRL